MSRIWDPRTALDLHPDQPGFICSGITQRGLRCRQSFIANRDKAEASDILDELLTNDDVFDNPHRLLPILRNLAKLTLCPRWHRAGHRSQVDTVASKWLSIIQNFNSQRTAPSSRTSSRRNISPSRSNHHSTFRSNERHLDTLSTITTSASRNRSNYSTLSSLPTPPATFRQYSLRSSRQITVPAPRNSHDGHIHISVTVSSPNGETTTTNVSQRLPRDNPPSTTSISVSTGSPQTAVNISNTPLSRGRRNMLTPSVTPRTLSVASSGRSTPRTPTSVVSASESEADSDAERASEDHEDTDPGSPTTPTIAARRQPTVALSSPSRSPRIPSAPAPSITSLAQQRPVTVSRKPFTDPCPVCLLNIRDSSASVWCQSSCGQNVCQACFDEWRAASDNLAIPLRCVYW
jgi:hypothetical protein